MALFNAAMAATVIVGILVLYLALFAIILLGSALILTLTRPDRRPSPLRQGGRGRAQTAPAAPGGLVGDRTPGTVNVVHDFDRNARRSER